MVMTSGRGKKQIKLLPREVKTLLQNAARQSRKRAAARGRSAMTPARDQRLLVQGGYVHNEHRGPKGASGGQIGAELIVILDDGSAAESIRPGSAEQMSW
jgi:hypothetical protein